MKQLYDMGLALTFMLLCVNGVYMIATDQMQGLLPGSQLEEINTTELTDIADRTEVTSDIDRPDYSAVRSGDYREKEQQLDILLWQMVFGWSALLNGILLPYGLTIISDVLYFILAPIQVISLGYLAMLTITALRGGFSA